MDPSGVACTNCGKNMTTDDLRRTSCVHCGQVLAHHARAAQQVALVNQMLGPAIANARQAHAPYGPMPSPYGPVAGYGAPPPGGLGTPSSPMAFGYPQTQFQVGQVEAGIQKAAMGMVIAVVVGLAVTFIAAGMVFFFVLAG